MEAKQHIVGAILIFFALLFLMMFTLTGCGTNHGADQLYKMVVITR